MKNSTIWVIILCTIGSNFFTTAANGDEVNWWLATCAGILASIVAVVSVAGNYSESSSDRNWPAPLAGIAAGAGIFTLYQFALFSVYLGIGAGLAAMAVDLESNADEAIKLGIFASLPMLLAPVALLIGATVIYRGKSLFISTFVALLTLMFLAFSGQIIGIVLGKTEHLEQIQQNGWIRTILSFAALVALFSILMAIGAGGRLAFGFLMEKVKGK